MPVNGRLTLEGKRAMGVPVTVIILTYNEERNLPNALQSVIGWADQVIVVDSYSTDQTVDIAHSYGAEVYQHPFRDYVDQRNWALTELPLKHEWVLFLDADERPSQELKKEIERKLPEVPMDVNGFYIRRRFYFLGRWIKQGDMFPKLIRLFRRGCARYVAGYGFREKLMVEGRVLEMKYHLVHEDQNGIDGWIVKQLKRATIDAIEELHPSRQVTSDHFSQPGITEDRWRTWVGQHLWHRIPRLMRPFVLFLYRYLLKLGFLDGWPGFIYHFLLQLWYPLMVLVKYEEIKFSHQHQGEKTSG